MSALYAASGDRHDLAAFLAIAGQSQQEPENVKASVATKAAVSADDMSGFGQSIGNGLFWLAPFILYFVPLAVSGFSLFDNGHLQNGFERCVCAAE